MINPGKLRREALERQQQEPRAPAKPTYSCPDCFETIDARRTAEDSYAWKGKGQPPPGWHDCPASRSRQTTYAKMDYDWKNHGR